MTRRNFPDGQKLSHDLKEWWAIAGPEARKRMMLEVDGDSRWKNNIQFTCSYGYDWSYAVDYSDDFYRLGDSFVYLYVSRSFQIYYVGMGNRERIMNRKRRNKAFLNRFSETDSKVVILAKWVDRNLALDIETLLIWEAQAKGYDLTNSSKTLSALEIEQLKFIQSESDLSEFQEHYVQLRHEYPEIVAAFEKLNTNCLLGMLTPDGVLPETDDFINHPRPGVAVSQLWTIDGKIKSVVEWCKLYGKSPSSVVNRMRNWQCTPKEALTFPSVPNGENRNAIEWLKSKGYVPGTDTTSEVTPFDEWPKEYRLRNI